MTATGTKNLMSTMSEVMPLFMSFMSSVDVSLSPEETQNIFHQLILKMGAGKGKKNSVQQSYSTTYKQFLYTLTVEKEPGKPGVLIVSASTEQNAILSHEENALLEDGDFGVNDLKILQKSADEGDAVAQVVIADAYFKGTSGYPQNDALGAKYVEKAAKQNHAISQYGFGMLYLVGKGVDEDYEKAAHWLQKSATQGYDKAQFWLGKLYYKGLGVNKNEDKAFYWIKKSSGMGNGDAKAWLKENAQ